MPGSGMQCAILLAGAQLFIDLGSSVRLTPDKVSGFGLPAVSGFRPLADSEFQSKMSGCTHD
jgi:hypothetical protein